MLPGLIIVDMALAFASIELVALVLYRQRTGRGPSVKSIASNLVAGLLLMLGVRLALVGVEWPWLAACLAAAGVAHVVDLASRWTATTVRKPTLR